MTVPQSLLLAALAVAWIVLLVPSLTRRRDHVRESVEGSGFRVLSRTPAAGRRMPRRRSVPTAEAQDRPRNIRSEDQMSSQQVDDSFRAEDDTVVLDGVDNVGGSPEAHGSHPFDEARDGANDAWDEADDSGDVDEIDDEAREEAAAFAEVAREDAITYDDRDEAELRRQYQAWRATTRLHEPAAGGATAGATQPADDEAPEPTNVRPIPRRPGRGVYDPEAAERARAYKFARRRRAVLVLTLLIVGFAVAAVLLSATLWIGAVVSAVLLALFLTYLRRQVRIEADIRARRLAKLERARQIRPEHSHPDAGSDDPYAQRAPGSSQASGPVRQRSNRVVLDLDDDDPGFDDLEQYEPMEYRRAVGQ